MSITVQNYLETIQHAIRHHPLFPSLALQLIPPVRGAQVDLHKINDFEAAHSTGYINNVWVTKFTNLPVGAKISAVGLLIFTAVSTVRVKVYQDDGTSGDPSTLLGESNSISVTAGSGQVQYFPLITPATVPASGNVYAGFETLGTGLDLYATTGQPSGTRKHVAHTYGTGPNPFGTVTNDVTAMYTAIIVTQTNGNETVQISEATRTIRGRIANIASTVQISEAEVIHKGLVRLVSAVEQISEAEVIHRGLVRLKNEIVQISESTTIHRGLHRIINAFVNISESQTIHRGLSRIVNEVVQLVEYVFKEKLSPKGIYIYADFE